MEDDFDSSDEGGSNKYVSLIFDDAVVPDEEVACVDTLLSSRQKLVLRMWGLGRTPTEIAEVTGYTPTSIYTIRKSKPGQEYLKLLEAELDQDFMRLHLLANQTLERAMRFPDPHVQLAAVNLFYKKAGKFVVKTETRDKTAEDIIQMLMSRQLPTQEHEPQKIQGVVVSDALDAEVGEVTELTEERKN